MDENCFQTIEQIQQESTHIQNHQIPIINIALQANPILPEGKHLEKTNQFLKHKLNFLNENSTPKKSNLPKLNIMTVSSHYNKKRYSLFQSATNQSNLNTQQKTEKNNRLQLLSRCGRPIQEKSLYEDIPYFDQPIHEFYQFNQNSNLVYKRYDNCMLNYFSKIGKRYYASTFLDIKELEKQQKIVDIYEYLNKKFPYKIFLKPEENLKFDSNFQSGNLFSVYKIGDKQYNCFMQNDINTKGSTQWFYFKIQNIRRTKIKLNIINFYKPSSLYEKGMKPLIFSSEKYKAQKQDWKRGGQSIIYEQSIVAENFTYYKLSFIYEFEYSGDQVYFAYSFPYTYTDLKKYIEKISENQSYKKILKTDVLCKSYLNKNIYLLEITQDINSKQKKKKQIIYVIARQHPGQSPASYVLEGVVNFLLSNRLETFQLRAKFLFKIIPMVNPDGVFIGNYRTNLSGNDINRKWDFPNRIYHPQIVGIKKLISEDKTLIKMFLDLHAHSRKMNSFFYGGEHLQKSEHKFYPFICSKLNKDISYGESSFANDSSKRSTARVVFQQDFSIKKSYTFQTSFYGKLKNNKKQHFQKIDLRNLGQSLMLGVFYTQIGVQQQTKNWSIFQKLKLLKEKQILLGLQQQQKYMKQIKIIELTMKQFRQKWRRQPINMTKNDSIGSNSDPDQFQLKQQQLQQFQQLQSNLINILTKVDNINNQKNQQLKKKQILPKHYLINKKQNKQQPVLEQRQNKKILINQEKKGNTINIQQISLCIQHQPKKQPKAYKYDTVQLKKTLKSLIQRQKEENDLNKQQKNKQSNIISKIHRNRHRQVNSTIEPSSNFSNTINKHRACRSYQETILDVSYIPLSYNKSLQRNRIFKMNAKNVKTNKIIIIPRNFQLVQPKYNNTF